MANAYGRTIDGTDLDLDQAEERGILHRDYLTHCIRWSHIAQMLHKSGRYADTRVLDVGCGCDIPLPRLLHSNRLLTEHYLGMDFNPSSKFKAREFGSMDVELHGDAIFPRDVKLLGSTHYKVKDGPAQRLPNLIVCLEVLEHVTAAHALTMMKAFYRIAKAGDGEVVISTPCWNVTATAKNHVNEMRHAALGTALEDVGFAIDHNFGTFASISEYKDALFAKYGEGVERFFNDAREYHDTNVLANMFCTSFPGLSRNSLWRLTPAKEGYVRKFPSWDTIPKPWTSAEDWENLASAHTI